MNIIRQVLHVFRDNKKLVRRKRRGFTLLETTVSVSISAIVVLGTALLAVNLQERLAIEHDIQLAREWGNNYVEGFTRSIRNGMNHNFDRAAAPCKFSIDVVDRDDMTGPDDIINLAIAPDTVRMTYLYDYSMHLPIFQIDRRNYYDLDFPDSGDERSEFYVVPGSFKIEAKDINDRRWGRDRLGDLNDSYITISFELRYRRAPLMDVPLMRPYEKYLKFYGSAYMINANWPVEDVTLVNY